MISERAKAVEAAATLAMSRLAKAMQADGIDVINLVLANQIFKHLNTLPKQRLRRLKLIKPAFIRQQVG